MNNRSSAASSWKKFVKVSDSPQLWRGLALISIGLIVFSQLFTVSMTIKPKFELAKRQGQSQSGSASVSFTAGEQASSSPVNISGLQQQVLPAEGVELPITWGDLGQKMVEDGVIDEQKFRALFKNGLSTDQEQILSGQWDQPVVMTQENSRFLLDMLWAFGLANTNPILTEGEMTDAQYGGDASKFASTGGWSLATGKAMDHYSRHAYISLSPEQQRRVDQVSRGIYRPCCGNSTHFPDCNHGMAMLGLLELMAAQNVSEADMYRVALAVNSYWFPQTYLDLATYFKEQGTEWKDVDPQLALSAEYSSAKGYQQTRQQIKSLPKPQQGGGGCGV